MQTTSTSPIPPVPPRDILRTALLLSRISGHPASPVFDNGSWRYRFELTPEDAGALISAADNPDALVRLMAPVLARFRRAAR